VNMDWYVADLSARIDFLRTRVKQVVLALPSWGAKKITWFLPDDHAERYACVRDHLRGIAAYQHLKTIDLAAELCPEGPESECNDDRKGDGLHVDPEEAPAVLNWILDNVESLKTIKRTPHNIA